MQGHEVKSSNSRSHDKNLIYIQVNRSAYPQTHWSLSTEYRRRDFKLMPHFFLSKLQQNMVKSKGKGLPRQAEVAQGVPGSLRPRIVLTFRRYKGGRSSAKRTGRLYPSRNPWYSLSEAESTSGHMVLSGVPRKKSTVIPPGIDPGTSRLVAQCLNHYATPGPLIQ